MSLSKSNIESSSSSSIPIDHTSVSNGTKLYTSDIAGEGIGDIGSEVHTGFGAKILGVMMDNQVVINTFVAG